MMDKQISKGKQIRTFLADNIVSVIFAVLILFGFIVGKGITLTYFVEQLFQSVFRNGFLVLSLIIPVIAGLGMNFGIVVGAMSAQIALVTVRYFDVPGFMSLLICVIMAAPLAMLFGFLTGKLYNRTRGQEMIAGLIVGYFADGLYKFLMLFVIGFVIPVSVESLHTRQIINPSGIGIRMTVDMGDFAYSVDKLWRIPFMTFVLIAALIFLLYLIIQFIRKRKNPALGKNNILLTGLYGVVCLFFIVVSVQAMITKSPLMKLRPEAPVFTILSIALLGVATHFLLKTKLGQDFRSVGQSQQIARVSGINVDKTRIIAVMISTVLAAWGMLLYLQNMGTLNVYGAHTQIGLFSVASLLVGGASTQKATVKNAFIGVLLFNSMFIVSPAVGMTLFGDAQNAEYIRTFMVYAVIGLSLGLYVWRGRKNSEQKVE
ncbi:MAG: ABC transporter permease [Clostridiales bacterium]|nr:ABC transporter permease [Clostridiales bacterium]